MNVEAILQNAQTQGPVFWAAATAMTLGATLLVVSVWTMFQRILKQQPQKGTKRFRFPRWNFKTKHKGIPASVPVSFSVKKTETGYQPMGALAFAVKDDRPSLGAGEAQELVARLQAAANTLEEIRQSLRQDNFQPGFSALKHEAEGVEYLYKTTAV